MKVALVHDDLMQWGGAERVLEAISEIYLNAPIYTSVFNEDNKELKTRFKNKKIVTSFIQNIPGWKSLYKTLLPFYPIAFEQFDFSKYDLVISQSTRFAKSIITQPQTLHINYCHTPPRFLWRFSEAENLGLKEILLSYLRIYDQISAKRVDAFLAGSENSKKRIKKVYGMDARVVLPFVDVNRFKGLSTFNGGYWVVISRLIRYKRVDLAIKACKKLNQPLKIIGSGPENSNLKILAKDANIEFLEELDDESVALVLAGAKGLIVPGVEDFGITPLEAQALGKPVIAFKNGGVLETVIDGKTGLLFDRQTVDGLINAMKKLEKIKINSQDCINNALKFSKDNFKRNFVKEIHALESLVPRPW